ncbi:MAG TPA: DUF4097 family beta strand repeat-containing protein [Pyrinomonadaceae bacterium]|jgi:hypothetical protein
MHKRTLSSALLICALACGLALQPLAALAEGGQDRPESAGSVSINNTAGRVSVRLDRGSKVAISNRYGRITITGWERDTVEATATDEKGVSQAIQVELTADPQARSVLSLGVVGRGRGASGSGGFPFIFGTPNPEVYFPPEAKEKVKQDMNEQIKQDMKEQIKEAAKSGVILVPVPEVIVKPQVVVPARPERQTTPPRAPQPAQPGQPAVAGQAPRAAQAARAESSGRIDLDVKVPRYAELSGIEVRSGDLTISNVDGPVNITSGSSDIKVNHVGAVEVHARSGSVTVEDVAGLAYVAASSGSITVRRAQGDVRAVSINGDIDIQCVRGRVDVSNARGAIKLAAISGDVDATTTSSDIIYTGAIQDNARYRLKSVEGEVRMAIPDNSPGFTAMISSYNGDVLTDFAIRNQNPAGQPNNHRVEARQGNGQALITLDSFSQPVRLTKLTTPTTACQ